MDWTPILGYVQGLAPWAGYVLMGLGTAVILGLGIDAVIDDEKDHGFMKKIMALPILGDLLEHLKKYSPLNTRKKIDKE